MGQPGRKKKAGKREPNGRMQRPSREQMQDMQQLLADAEKRVVLMQPHRRGDKSQEAGSAFGRFILRCPIEHRPFFKHAGEDYATWVRGWRAAKGIPGGLTTGEGGSGGGASPETVEKWFGKMIKADRVMSGVSHNGWLYVRQLVLDEYDIGGDQDGFAIMALEALAVDLGMMRATRHPYVA